MITIELTEDETLSLRNLLDVAVPAGAVDRRAAAGHTAYLLPCSLVTFVAPTKLANRIAMKTKSRAICSATT
jgi:hypothetical protein